MTGRRKIQLRQLLALVVAWQVAAILISAYDHFVMQANFVSIHEESYSFPVYLIFNMVAALGGGLIAGPLIIFWVNEKFLNKPYGVSILLVVFFFLTITIFLILLMGIFYISYTTGTRFGEERFWEQYNPYIFNLFQVKKLLVWSVIVAVTQLALQMDRKFSHGVLWKIILGKYHLPKEENRIFMFADLSGSTTIAETIGDEKYHLLLRDFFSDITNAIINNQGSIYQYVGDQVIVSWKIEKNGAVNHCVQCFFDMKKSIEDKKEAYMKNYGLVPDFKAGIHSGKVIAGEIGIIKRDITYSGDVLNTTSRIQGKCGELDVDLIASDDSLALVNLQPGFISEYMGSIKLKGKKKEIGLNAIFVSEDAAVSAG
ncbi:MAG TPA: adenylate/guanylate cyclase domain-containing protein [Bacteroidia bacterium]|nr:adenylate/guanylate cyclase domain-containing protein [Bacteroidia bacterium]